MSISNLKGGLIIIQDIILEQIYCLDNISILSKEEYLILICIQGSCKLTDEKERYSMGSGQFAILSPHSRLSILPSGNISAQIILVRLSCLLLKELSTTETDLIRGFSYMESSYSVVDAPHSIFMLIQSIVRRLLVINNENIKYGQDIFKKGLIASMIILILRACITQDKNFKPKVRSHFVLEDIFAYIKNHLSEPITLDKLSSTFYISKSHISREFKRQCGQTVHCYITKVRLEYCCRLLMEGKHVSEAYHVAGFKDYNNFFRTFKQHYGMTPKEYVKLKSKA